MEPDAIGLTLKVSKTSSIGAPSSTRICFFVNEKLCSGACDCKVDKTLHSDSGKISGRVDAH